MLRRGCLYLLAMLAGAGLILALAWPSIQREMMRAPITDALNAVRAGDTVALRACFMPDATIAYFGLSLPVNKAVELMAPHMRNGQMRGAARVSDLTNITARSKTEVDADVTITLFIDGGDDLPYRSIPIRRSGHLVLQRTGLFSYKILQVSTQAAEFRERLQ